MLYQETKLKHLIFTKMKNRENIHDNWETPPFILNRIRELFGDYFDPCPINHDLNDWDALKCSWWLKGDKHKTTINFVNPPYSDLKATGNLKSNFIKKTIIESYRRPSLVLIPDSRDSRLYHRTIREHMTFEYPVEGRIPFIGINTKGQFVNYHLILPYVTRETIKDENGKDIPMYVKNNGQHSSAFILFDPTNKIIDAERRIIELSKVMVNYKNQKR